MAGERALICRRRVGGAGWPNPIWLRGSIQEQSWCWREGEILPCLPPEADAEGRQMQMWVLSPAVVVHKFLIFYSFPLGMTPSQGGGVSGCPEGRHLPKRFVQPRPPPAGPSDGEKGGAVGTGSQPPGCTHLGLCPALGWVVESRNGEGVKL